MQVFDLIKARDHAALAQLLAARPVLAGERDGAGASALAFAAYAGDVEAVAIVRAARGRLDPFEACIVGDVDAVEAALAEGWDPSQRSRDGFTPLALAAFFRQRPVFDVLLPLTADVNARAENRQRVAALHAAVAVRDAGMVAALLRVGADPDLPQAGGVLPIHVAAAHGDEEIVALLVQFGAAVATTDDAGQDAAGFAEAQGHRLLSARLQGLSPAQLKQGSGASCAARSRTTSPRSSLP